MIITVVDAVSQKSLCSFGSAENIFPTPVAGDVLVLPDGEQYHVLQRAYICRKRTILQPGEIIPLNPAQQQIDFEIRCVVAPLGRTEEYMRKLEEVANAGT